MKNLKLWTLSFLLLFFLLPHPVEGAFVRENYFMDKTGSERVAELKKFQARMNLPVTGNLDDKTKTALYTKDYEVKDDIDKAPTKGIWLVINKSRRTLTMYQGKQSLGKFPVTLGTTATPTPTGKGKIMSKHVNPAWGGMGGKYTPRAANDPLNPLGERWMGLSLTGYNGYGIHGNIKPHQIGGYYSNGCIRMFNYDIEQYVFPKVPMGAPVWLGTDQELEQWGVYQRSRVAPPPAKAQPKPTPPKEEIPEFKTEDLLVF